MDHPIFCKLCSAGTVRVKDLQELRIHCIERHVTTYCELCDRQFASMKVYLDHETSKTHKKKVFHRGERIKCVSCAGVWTSPDAFRGHMAKNHSFSCEVCEVFLTSRRELQEHFNSIEHEEQHAKGSEGKDAALRKEHEGAKKTDEFSVWKENHQLAKKDPLWKTIGPLSRNKNLAGLSPALPLSVVKGQKERMRNLATTTIQGGIITSTLKKAAVGQLATSRIVENKVEQMVPTIPAALRSAVNDFVLEAIGAEQSPQRFGRYPSRFFPTSEEVEVVDSPPPAPVQPVTAQPNPQEIFKDAHIQKMTQQMNMLQAALAARIDPAELQSAQAQLEAKDTEVLRLKKLTQEFEENEKHLEDQLVEAQMATDEMSRAEMSRLRIEKKLLERKLAVEKEKHEEMLKVVLKEEIAAENEKRRLKEENEVLQKRLRDLELGNNRSLLDEDIQNDNIISFDEPAFITRPPLSSRQPPISNGRLPSILNPSVKFGDLIDHDHQSDRSYSTENRYARIKQSNERMANNSIPNLVDPDYHFDVPPMPNEKMMPAMASLFPTDSNNTNNHALVTSHASAHFGIMRDVNHPPLAQTRKPSISFSSSAGFSSQSRKFSFTNAQRIPSATQIYRHPHARADERGPDPANMDNPTKAANLLEARSFKHSSSSASSSSSDENLNLDFRPTKLTPWHQAPNLLAGSISDHDDSDDDSDGTPNLDFRPMTLTAIGSGARLGVGVVGGGGIMSNGYATPPDTPGVRKMAPTGTRLAAANTAGGMGSQVEEKSGKWGGMFADY